MLASLELASRSGIAWAVSDRAIGNLSLSAAGDAAAVVSRRAALARRLGFEPADLVCAQQVHGDRVARVGPGDRASVVPEADALVTDEPGLLLMLLFADCVPVLLFDAERRCVGAAHAGWKGTARSIAARTVAALAGELGARPEALRAVVGPAIGGCCYEVDDGVADAVAASVPGTEVRRPGRRGRPHIDLASANLAQLTAAGLRPEHVEMVGICTACSVDRFFSHRAEAGRAGRHAAVIGVTR